MCSIYFYTLCTLGNIYEKMEIEQKMNCIGLDLEYIEFSRANKEIKIRLIDYRSIQFRKKKLPEKHYKKIIITMQKDLKYDKLSFLQIKKSLIAFIFDDFLFIQLTASLICIVYLIIYIFNLYDTEYIKIKFSSSRLVSFLILCTLKDKHLYFLFVFISQLIVIMNQIQATKQSTKILKKFKSTSIDQRVNTLSKQILGISKPPQRNKPQNNHPIQIKKIPETDMINKINALQSQLKKKINEDSILRNFFKTLNTSAMSHIDIYLELRKTQQIIIPLTQRIQEQCSKSMQYHEDLKAIQMEMQQKQEQYLQKMQKKQEQQRQKQFSYCSYIDKLQSQLSKVKNDHQISKMLISQLKKKNQSLNRKLQDSHLTFKQSTKSLEFSKKDQIDNLKNRIDELQSQRSILKSELYRYKEEILSENELNNNLESNVAEMSYLYSKALDKIETCEEKIQQFNRLKTQLQSDNKQYSCMIRERQEELNELKEKYQEITKKSTQLQENIKNESLSLEEKQQELIRIKKQLMKLSSQFSEQKKRISYLQLQKLKLKEQITEISKILENYMKKDKFRQTQHFVIFNRLQQEKNQYQKTIDKLQNKLFQMNISNQTLSKKSQQLKKQLLGLKYSQKATEKMFFESYKTVGRLFQINKQIYSILYRQRQGKYDQNQESLEIVAAELTNNAQKLIFEFKNQSQQKENLKIRHYLCLKEVISILNRVKKFIGQINTETLISNYCQLILGMQKTSISNQNLSQIYHQIIQKLIWCSNERMNKNQHHSQQQKDSLDNITIKVNNKKIENREYNKKQQSDSLDFIQSNQYQDKENSSFYVNKNIGNKPENNKMQEKRNQQRFKKRDGKSLIEKKYFKN